MAVLSSRRKSPGAVIVLLLVLVLGVSAAQPALAITAPIHIAGTSAQGVYLRPTPDTSQGPVGWMAEGTSPDYNCFTYGQMVGNVNVWFSVNYGGATGYYASYFDDSSYSSEADLTAKYGIPKCGAQPPPPAPSVTLAQGLAAPVGYRYAITLDHFGAGQDAAITCYDSVSPGGFYTFSLTADGSGHAFTQDYCYSGDGPDHWVVASGVQSNHISWGSAGGGSTPPPPPPAAGVTLTQGPAAAAGYWYSVALVGFAGNSSVTIACLDSVSPSGFKTFSVATDGSGAALTSTGCFSGDGPDHWVMANGVQSNHVSWGALPGGGGGGGGGVSSGSYAACHLQLQRGAGARERAVLALSSNFDSAARAAGIACQNLARIIYHEGGNYLSIRRSATQEIEYTAIQQGRKASVGIGQIKVETAKLVSLLVYHDYATASLDDATVGTTLIFNDEFSLKIAAGYVKLMQEAGINGDLQLFIAYSLSLDSAKQWKALDYTLDRARLSKYPQYFNPSVMIKRRVYFNEAVHAIS